MKPDQLIKWGIEGLLKVEPLQDPEKEAERVAVCDKCDYYNADKDTCKKCGCFMKAIKTKLKYNFNPKKQFRIEITHCPEGFWGDKDIANLYRERDGKELIT